MLIQYTLRYMEEETENRPDEKSQGRITSPFYEIQPKPVTNAYAFHSLWQKIFSGMAVFSDSDVSGNKKDTLLSKKQFTLNPNWPLRDGDL